MSLVARRYDVNANQVFNWRKRYRDEVGDAATPPLVPVLVTPDRPAPASSVLSGEAIEIDLAGGYRVRVGRGVEASALRVVLEVLERR